MNETGEQIRQRIQKERGEYKRERKKKFRYLKHIGQMDNYNQQKIPMMTRLKPIIRKLRWWQRIYIFLVIGFRRLWRKIKRK